MQADSQPRPPATPQAFFKWSGMLLASVEGGVQQTHPTAPEEQGNDRISDSATGQDSNDPPVPQDRRLYVFWTGQHADGQDMTQEVSIPGSLRPVEFDSCGCTGAAGQWFDPGTEITVRDPSALDTDHVVPLAEALGCRAASWDAGRRHKLANGLSQAGGLIAVRAAADRHQGCSSPAFRLSPKLGRRFSYVPDRARSNVTWRLAMNEDEKAGREVLQDSRSWRATAASRASSTQLPDSARHDWAKIGVSCTDINVANSATLQTASGIGPAKARAIIEYRGQFGPFATLEDVTRGSGIGQSTIENIRQAGFCATKATRLGGDSTSTAYSPGDARDPERTDMSNCADINAASGAKLQTVTGVGPSKARGITRHRERNGPFRRLEDLLDVSGIGPVTLRNIRRAGFCVQ